MALNQTNNVTILDLLLEIKPTRGAAVIKNNEAVKQDCLDLNHLVTEVQVDLEVSYVD
jgi:hypothetical protein